MVNEWKPEKNISSPWDVDVWEHNIGQPVVKTEYAVSSAPPSPYSIHLPKRSGWTCYLFGAAPGHGLCYVPQEGRVPNRFVRWMMKLCFDCTWVKNV